MPPPKNPSTESMAADVAVIGTEIKAVKELLERSDSEAERRLNKLESQVDDALKRLIKLEKSEAAGKAASEAIEKEREKTSGGWGLVASWAGVVFSILAALASAAWALFVRGEK